MADHLGRSAYRQRGGNHAHFFVGDPVKHAPLALGISLESRGVSAPRSERGRCHPASYMGSVMWLCIPTPTQMATTKLRTSTRAEKVSGPGRTPFLTLVIFDPEEFLERAFPQRGRDAGTPVRHGNLHTRPR
jgi:hypothetical protein